MSISLSMQGTYRNNKSNKEYDDSEYFDMYKYLIARELPYMEKLSNKKLAELL